MKSLKEVSELNWRTYLNHKLMESKFKEDTYAVVYMDGDEFKAIQAENPRLLARAILEAMCKQKKVYWAGAMNEYKQINDSGKQ